MAGIGASAIFVGLVWWLAAKPFTRTVGVLSLYRTERQQVAAITWMSRGLVVLGTLLVLGSLF